MLVYAASGGGYIPHVGLDSMYFRVFQVRKQRETVTWLHIKPETTEIPGVGAKEILENAGAWAIESWGITAKLISLEKYTQGCLMDSLISWPISDDVFEKPLATKKLDLSYVSIVFGEAYRFEFSCKVQWQDYLKSQCESPRVMCSHTSLWLISPHQRPSQPHHPIPDFEHALPE